MVQSSREPGADPPASRFVVARVSRCYAIFAKGPAHLVERRAVAVVRPAVWSFVILDGLLRRLYGRAADRFSQREEVGVVPHGSGAGQFLMLLLALTASGSRTVGFSRRTQMFASIPMPAFAARANAPRRCVRASAALP